MVSVQTDAFAGSRKITFIIALALLTVAITLTAAPVSAEGPSISGDTTAEAAPGNTVSATYTVVNEGETAQSALIEFEELSSTTKINDVTGDVSSSLLGSSPPGVITREIDPGASATITATYAVSESASSGLTNPINVKSTFTGGGTTQTDSVTTDLSTPTPKINLTAVDSKSIQNGSQFSITYTIANEVPSLSTASILVESPASKRPSTISVESGTGDVSQDLIDGTPPGVITESIATGESASITITYSIPESVPLGTTSNIGVTAETNNDNYNDNVNTEVTVTKDPLANRFGGSDSEVGNLDILSAVNAANRNKKIGGSVPDNLEILQLVNKATDSS